MGNHLARTPLFKPVQRGRRAVIDKEKLPSPNGISLWYFGRQLDVCDQDVYLVALMLAKGHGPDIPIAINRAELLHLTGRKADGRTYQWLSQSFDRLSTGRLFYDTPSERGSTPLIGPLSYDKDTGEYYFTIPKASLRAFGFDQFGFVDMEKRRQLINKTELAKWIQCYAISHQKGEHCISVENLMSWSGCEGRERRFRGTLREALTELVRVAVLDSFEFYDGDKKVKWIR